MTLSGSPGQAIRKARLAIHMGQEHLAAAAGVSERTVRRVEKDLSISAESMRGICSALQIDARTVPKGKTPLKESSPMASRLPGVARSIKSPWPPSPFALVLPNGERWHYRPGSSIQDSFVDVAIGPPGTGKSSVLHGCTLSLCGEGALPGIVSLDAGPTALFWAEALRDSLPVHRRKEIVTISLTNEAANAINPFEIPLGYRVPGTRQRRNLSALLCAIAFCPELSGRMDEVRDLSGLLVDLAYERDRPYLEGLDPETDDAVATLKGEGPLTWTEVVDALYAAGLVPEAERAQRFASPTLETCLGCTNDPRFAMARTEEAHRGLVGTFKRQLLKAYREFAILRSPAVYHPGMASIIALDLEAVLPRGAWENERRCSIMYLTAASLARDFMDNKEDLDRLERGLPCIRTGYHGHHEFRIRMARSEVRRLVLDEMHRGLPHLHARETFLLPEVREARKWGMHVGIGTQILDDAALVDMTSGLFAMSPMPGLPLRQVQATAFTWALTEDEERALAAGMSVGVFHTKIGRRSVSFGSVG